MCSLMFSTKIPKDIDNINEYMVKRGPDITNKIVINNNFYLHNLLSITGKMTPQPVFNDDKSIICLYNGEIYNYTDFGNYDCDTNCIIPLYKKYGKDFAKNVSGEFAIILVDSVEKEIIIITDTFGTKPLFISNTDGFGVATYKSALLRTGFQNITKIQANSILIYDLNTFKLKSKNKVTIFDLHQHKTSFEDFHKTFSTIIHQRCSNVREYISIGLSSGYDSGMIACELAKQKIPFKCYSVLGSENREILQKRYALLQNKCDLEIINITPEMRKIAHEWLLKNTEDWKYTIYSQRSNYNEFDLSLWDDNGSNNLSLVCSYAKRDNRKIFISGGGADEMYDYGGKYNHSNFGGVFPNDLTKLFPWASVFGSSMESYIMKDEMCGGNRGLETRYAFINKELWQEFLWLSPELKNKCYKSAMHNYLEINNFPFAPGQKIGF